MSIFDVKTDTGLGAITVDITAVIRLMIKVLPFGKFQFKFKLDCGSVWQTPAAFIEADIIKC